MPRKPNYWSIVKREGENENWITYYWWRRLMWHPFGIRIIHARVGELVERNANV